MNRWLALLVGTSVAAVVLVAASLGVAFAATNSVPSGKLGRSSQSISVDQRKPKPDCSSVTVTGLVVGTQGTSGADLLLGGSTADNINAKNGDDCVLGGGGDDALNGGPGTDVCIGGPGADTFTNCETQIQ